MAAPQAQQPVKRKGSLALIFSIGFVIIIVMSLPTVLIVFLGLLPTFVAYIVDRSAKKNAAFCVGGINLCGVFPYMLELWTGDNTMDQAIGILTNVYALIVMFGAAGFGWMVYQSLPPVIAAFLTVIAQCKISSLRNTQRGLIKEWGEDVSTPQEVIDLRDSVDLDDDSPDTENETPKSKRELPPDVTLSEKQDKTAEEPVPPAPSLDAGTAGG